MVGRLRASVLLCSIGYLLGFAVSQALAAGAALTDQVSVWKPKHIPAFNLIDQNLSGLTVFSDGKVQVNADHPIYFELEPGEVVELSHMGAGDQHPEVAIHIAQGRGIFSQEPSIVWKSKRRIVSNPISRRQWVMLRSDQSLAVSILTRDRQTYPSTQLWFEQHLSDYPVASSERNEELLPQLMRVPKSTPWVYQAAQDERVKVDVYVDFSDLNGVTNLATVIQSQIDQQAQVQALHQVNKNLRQHDKFGCQIPLSTRKELHFELKAGQTLQLLVSHDAYLGVSTNREAAYVFKANRPQVPDQVGLKESASLKQEKWFSVLRALNIPVVLELDNANNNLTARRHLAPVQDLFYAMQLNTVRGSALDPKVREVFLSESDAHANFKKVVFGTFHALNDKQTMLRFQLPKYRVLKELEIEVTANTSLPSLIPLEVRFDGGSTSKYWVSSKMLRYSAEPSALSAFLEAELDLDGVHHISQSSAFGYYRQKAPMVRSNFAYIPIPDHAAYVELTAPDSSRSPVWVSARDFVYRSVLEDSAPKDALDTKTQMRMMASYSHYQRAREIRESMRNGDQLPSGTANLSALIDYLESLPARSQTELLDWARFFGAVDAYFGAVTTEQSTTLRTQTDERLKGDDEVLWHQFETWLAGPQPSSALAVLTGIAVHHADPLAREKAVRMLLNYQDTLISANRLEQVVLASLRNYMEDFDARLPVLMSLWRTQGKYHWIKSMPKPADQVAEYTLLHKVVNRERAEVSPHTHQSLRADFQELNTLYHTRDLSAGDDGVKSYLQAFGYWQPDQTTVKQFTQHVRLYHNTRYALMQDAFLVGPQNYIRIRSQDLARYRLRAAPVASQVKMSPLDSEDVVLSVRSTAGRSAHIVSAISASNWQIDHSAGQAAQTVLNFSTIEFAEPHLRQTDILVSANQNTVLYLERLEDPMGVLSQTSMPLESITMNEPDSLVDRSPLNVSILGNPCDESTWKKVMHGHAFRPVAMSSVALPSFDSDYATKLLDPTELDQQLELLDQRRIRSAANLLRVATDHTETARYPELRSYVFNKVAWRELHDVADHGGLVRFKFKQGALTSHAAQQRRALSLNTLDHSLTITGNTVQGFKFSLDSPQTASLNLVAAQLFYEQPGSIKIWVQHGQADPTSILIDSGILVRHELSLEPGTSAVKVWLDETSEAKFVSVNIELPNTVSGQFQNHENYYVAQQASPLRLRIMGPQWLKVVRRNEQGDVAIQEEFIEEGWQVRQFLAPDDKRFYRFFVLQENYDDTKSYVAPAPNLAVSDTCQTGRVCLHRFSDYRSDEIGSNWPFQALDGHNSDWFDDHNDRFDTPAIDSSAATYGGNLLLVDRSNNDDDFELPTTFEQQFSELHVYRRQYSDNRNVYSSLDANVRRYDEDSVYHLGARFDWLPQSSRQKLDYVLQSSLWHQAGTDLQPSVSSGIVTGRVKFRYSPIPRLTTTSQASLWQRYSDVDTTTSFDRIDPDVWSEYKENHQNGLSLNQHGAYQVSLDSEAYVAANMRFNQGLSSLDRGSLRVGWRAYLKTASADVQLVRREFAADEHRQRRFGRTDLDIAGDWLLPLAHNSNFRVGARVRYSPDDDKMSWWINLGWFDHRGQQLRDFHPGELRFRQTRDWWASKLSSDKFSETHLHD